jgi:2'-5' RNA ligase
VSETEQRSSGRERRVRLFCALDPPQSTVAAVAAWQRDHADERLRAVPPAALHATVAFLGERPEEEIEPAAAELTALGPRTVPATLAAEPVPLPARRPRLLALGIDSEAAVELQRELATRLESAGLYSRPQRPFWPHLTVFRIRGGGKGHGSRRAPPPRVGAFGGGDGHAFDFVRVALYRSDLRPGGASYSRLAANELPQAGG